MFGFQRFTETDSCFVINLILFFMCMCNLIAFVKLETPIICLILICFSLVLFIVVNMVMSMVVVVYLDGELESVTKEKFLEAIKNQDVSYILSRGENLDTLMSRYFLLSAFELRLVESEIARILWKRESVDL